MWLLDLLEYTGEDEMIPAEITNDLRNGMKLDDCLIKHHTNLNELFSDGVKVVSRAPKECVKTNRERYIQYHRNGSYILKKYLKGEGSLVFGYYNSIEDAVKVREVMERIGWKRNKVDEICEELGVERRTGNYVNKGKYS